MSRKRDSMSKRKEPECVVIDNEEHSSNEALQDDEFKYEVSLEPGCLELPLKTGNVDEEDPLADSGSCGGSEDEFRFEVALEPECLVVPFDDLPNKCRLSLLSSRDRAESTSVDELESSTDSFPHTNTNDKVCDNCGRQYAHKRSLIRHIAKCLRGTKPKYPIRQRRRGHRLAKYTCEICTKVCDDIEHLKDHIRTHNDGKPLTCEVCKKEFALLYNLKKHQRIHVGDISCKVCNKTFATLSHLKRHQPIHTAEKTLACEACDEKFATMSSLKIHERTHTGEKVFSCKVCPKEFTTASNLRIHEYIHTGEKPHACEVCDKRFTQMSTLNNHRRVHTGEKPYSCEHCSRTFAFLGNYKAHKQTHFKVRKNKKYIL